MARGDVGNTRIGRRQVLTAGALAAGGAGLAPGAAVARSPEPEQTLLPAQVKWSPVPAQAPARDSMIDVGGAKLWCWDTGGPGEPVVLLHAATGSGAVWGYQQPAFVKAGYRVVGYSRRGHYRSEAGPAGDRGHAARDLAAIADALKLGRFHLVGVAAGGFMAPDFALAYPDRLLSLTIASSLAGVVDPEFAKASAAMVGGGVRELTPAMRELGPSYRAGYPEGAAIWEAAERAARPTVVDQPPLNTLSWDAIARIQVPTLLMTGDADMFMPPSRLRQMHARFAGAEMAVVAEAGHAIYWEQPLAFNAAVLAFVGRRRAPAG